MFDEHWIFFVYTFLNTLSRIVARQVSVRLERRLPRQSVPNPNEEVMSDEAEDIEEGEELQDERV